MYGKYRLSEFLMPKIATLVKLDSIQFNILMEIAQYIGVIQLTLKAGMV
jgi:Zn-dependent peptidase ImmA (M78 family)